MAAPTSRLVDRANPIPASNAAAAKVKITGLQVGSVTGRVRFGHAIGDSHSVGLSFPEP